MTSLEVSALTDPTAIAQQVAAEQAAEEHSRPTNDAPDLPHWENLVDFEVDTDPDRDSALGDDYESFTTSINSTNADYKIEHGRRYHAFDEPKYPLPNDDEEVNRLELQHRIWEASLHGRLALAPIPEPSEDKIRTALDIGCGTGAWAIEFAENYPSAHVTGTDLSPIQPNIVPPNVTFLVDDVTRPWVYPHRFDYIHSRSIGSGIADWETLIAEIWRNLEPGGWVELQEFHMPMQCDDETVVGTVFEKWNRSIVEACQKVGVKLDFIFGVPALLRRKGFVGLGEAETKWALGPWPKDRRQKRIGRMFQDDILGNLEGITTRMFTKALGWEREAVLAHLQDVGAEIKGGRMHAYMPLDLVWAQKPVDAVD